MPIDDDGNITDHDEGLVMTPRGARAADPWEMPNHTRKPKKPTMAADLLKSMDQFRTLDHSDEPNIIIMTDGARDKILAACEPMEGPTADRIDGIPFESYPDELEALQRVAELREQGGWNIAYITE